MVTSKSIPFDGNNIVLIDQDKNYSTHTVESVLSRKLSYWKGWKCSIGLQSLYIDYDGNIYRGVCREGGQIEDISKISNEWITCNLEVCTCGADMAIPKAKTSEQVIKFFENGITKDFPLSNKLPTVSAEIVTSTNDETIKTVTWAVGRRCNFDCWYCPDTDHNSYDPHKTYDELMSVVDMLEANWLKGSKAKFSMLGGELTVFKDYLPFVEDLYKLGHRSITTTNGSRNAEYYAKLSAVSDVCFSIHLNYVKTLGLDQFVQSIEQAIKGRGPNWVSVRIMVDPGNLELAKDTYKILKDKFGNLCPINVKPVHPAPNVPLFKYDLNEVIWIRNPS